MNRNETKASNILYKSGIALQFFFVLCAVLVAHNIAGNQITSLYCTFSLSTPVWALHLIKWLFSLERVRYGFVLVSTAFFFIVSAPVYFFLNEHLDSSFSDYQWGVLIFVEVTSFFLFCFFNNVRFISQAELLSFLKRHKKHMHFFGILFALSAAWIVAFKYFNANKLFFIEAGNSDPKLFDDLIMGNWGINESPLSADEYLQKNNVKMENIRSCLSALKAVEQYAGEKPEKYTFKAVSSVTGWLLVNSHDAQKISDDVTPSWSQRNITQCKNYKISSHEIVMLTNLMDDEPENPRIALNQCAAAFMLDFDRLKSLPKEKKERIDFEMGLVVAFSARLYKDMEGYDMQAMLKEALPYYTEAKKAEEGDLSKRNELVQSCRYFALGLD